jgi:diguanylate cyclase (GGDEF)-like protein/PAS domain S-box-containing protein
LNQNLNQHIEIEKVLHNIIIVALQHRSLEKKLNAVLLLVLEIPWLSLEQKGCVFLIEEGGAALKMVAHHNLSDSLLTMCDRIKFGQCLCGKAAAEKKLIFRDCIDDDHTFNPTGMQPHGHYNVPIIQDHETLGVLNLYVKHGHSPEDLEQRFLTMVADMLASMIFNDFIFQAEKDQHKNIIETAVDSFITTNNAGVIETVNKATSTIFGYAPDELIGNNISMLMELDDSSHYDGYMNQYNKTGTSDILGAGRDVKAVRKDGQSIDIHLSLTKLKSKGVTYGFNNIIRDISQLKAHQKELQRLAHYDHLTGLPNRVLFAERFTVAMARSKRMKTHLAVCFLDIDNFKRINDEFGRDEGDLLLLSISQRIANSLREEDVVSRQGGDEFILLLEGINSCKECEQLISRILEMIAEPYVIKGKEHIVTASCGIKLYTDGRAVDIDTLVRRADQAMYQAKLLGKNTFAFFDSQIEKASQEHMAFIRNVSQAISDQEMVLYYQPKVNMRSGQMFGIEALIRWEHPSKGLIGPLDFLPQIEKTSTIVKLGDWVIEQALQQLEAWVQEGKYWVISINIDAHHFMKKGFHETLSSALESHPSVPSELLEIEILETVAFDDLKLVTTLILGCQKLGVSFALDDFGTGYSSLAYLKNLPTEWLKIDQSFVRDMLEDAEDFALVDSIISLSKTFKRQVIAEGVETVEHGVALLEIGCEYAQGYAIAKPMAADKIIKWEETYQVDKVWRKKPVLSVLKN